MAAVTEEFDGVAISELRRLWDQEYEVGRIIPSSTRPLPSKPLVLYEGLLDFAQLSPVLDAGCGNGRNSIYLASKGCFVDAVDVSPAALNLVGQRAIEAGVQQNIRISQYVLDATWPFPDENFRLALDSYVFCHILNRTTQEKYRNELHRVLKPGGLLYSSVFSTDDAYYHELATLSDSTNNSTPIVLDPSNGIRKYLYSEEQFKRFFSARFHIRYFAKFQFEDVVVGQTFRRSILTLILEK